jgi:hypothetical protein
MSDNNSSEEESETHEELKIVTNIERDYKKEGFTPLPLSKP